MTTRSGLMATSATGHWYPMRVLLIDIPVELVHAPLMIELLIDRSRFDGEVLVGERELDQLARRHGQNGVSASTRASSLGQTSSSTTRKLGE